MGLRINMTLFICYLSLLSCKSHSNNLVTVRVKNGDSNSIYSIEKRDSSDFENLFNRFYADDAGKFYIKSFGHKLADKKNEITSVFVEIQKLDNNTFCDYGLYFKDSSKVLCVFENSDGGNYPQMYGVDPKSFKPFSNVFGGKDSFHVFFQNRMLDSLNVKNVKVYSEIKNCANCKGYFTDGKIVYYGANKIKEQNFIIPKEFKFEE
jgi:hypothetical protein